LPVDPELGGREVPVEEDLDRMRVGTEVELPSRVEDVLVH
jgi:hypothetical protein